jgi:hypothetical protein
VGDGVAVGLLQLLAVKGSRQAAGAHRRRTLREHVVGAAGGAHVGRLAQPDEAAPDHLLGAVGASLPSVTSVGTSAEGRLDTEAVRGGTGHTEHTFHAGPFPYASCMPAPSKGRSPSLNGAMSRHRRVSSTGREEAVAGRHGLR